jgi:hypothetical protein
VVLADSGSDEVTCNRGKGTAAKISKLLRVNGIEVKRWTIIKWKKRGHHHTLEVRYGILIFRVWDVWTAIA